MKVSFALSYNKMNLSINKRKEELDHLTNEAGTGLRLNSAADDPLAWSQALDLRQGLRELEAFRKNIDFGVGWNNATESAIDNLSELLLQAKDIAIQAVGATSPETRAANLQALDQISKQAMETASTRYGDLYIFSGRSTSTAPFESSDLTKYNGGGTPFQIRTGRNARQTINLNGEEVFFYKDSAGQSTSILQTIEDLKAAITSGSVSDIQLQQQKIDAAYQHTTTMRTTVGARLDSLEQQQSSLESLKVDEKGRLAGLEEADLAEVITQLQQKQTAFEAALRITSLLDNLNLTKFL